MRSFFERELLSDTLQNATLTKLFKFLFFYIEASTYAKKKFFLSQVNKNNTSSDIVYETTNYTRAKQFYLENLNVYSKCTLHCPVFVVFIRSLNDYNGYKKSS